MYSSEVSKAFIEILIAKLMIPLAVKSYKVVKF